RDYKVTGVQTCALPIYVGDADADEFLGVAWAQANMAAYLAVAKPGDTLLGLALPHGGHLTHGAPVNFSGTLFRATHYGVREDTEIGRASCRERRMSEVG